MIKLNSKIISKFHRKFLNIFFILFNIVIINYTYASIVIDVHKPTNIPDYYNKYSEIYLNNGQSKIKVLGTLNSSDDGYKKLSQVANGLLEAIREPEVKQGFNNTELYLINVGDYPEVMPYTKGRSEFLIDVGENYRGGGVSNMIFQSEEFICKMGVITRYHKGVNDTAVRRWDNPIHEIGHWVEIYGKYRNKILNSFDFNKLPSHWQNEGIDEVFTILVTAWFDAQYSYYDMPQNREDFKQKFPDYYRLFQEVFSESVRDIGQYCANEKTLKYYDRLTKFQKNLQLDKLYGIYPKSIISKTGNKVPNVIQHQDSVYDTNFSYVIDEKLCSQQIEFSFKDNVSLKQCSNYCNDTNLCNRFRYNTQVNQCRLYAKYECNESQGVIHNDFIEFEYKKIKSNNINSKISNKLTTFEKLKVGSKLCSNNKKYLLTLQQDGNLCLYQAGKNNNREYVWCNMMHDYGQTSSTGLVMQRDGNLVLYKNADSSQDYIWDTKSETAYPSGYTALLEDNRNFVIYDGFLEPIWSTGTMIDSASLNFYKFSEC